MLAGGFKETRLWVNTPRAREAGALAADLICGSQVEPFGEGGYAPALVLACLENNS